MPALLSRLVAVAVVAGLVGGCGADARAPQDAVPAAGVDEAGPAALEGTPPVPADLAPLALEFDDPADLGELTALSDVEGGPDRLDRAEVGDGRLRLVPQAGGWYEDRRAAYLFREVDGDVIVHARVAARGVDGAVPRERYSLAGLMARRPQPPAELTARGKADYVFVTTGTGESGGQIETKTTDDGVSRLNLVPSGAPEPVDLLLARIGSTVVTAYRNPGGDWGVARLYERDDLPARLQWGVNAYSGYDSLDPALWGDIAAYNTTPTPAAGADLVADVDFVRFYRPGIAPGQDLARADRAELLRLLAPAD